MNLSSARKTFTLKTLRYYTCATALHQPPNLHHFVQLSIANRSLLLAQQAHARVLTHGLRQDPFTATKLISAYALFGDPSKSKLVFDSVEPKNAYLWNSMISGYVRNCVYNEAYELFIEMCYCNVLPDDYTFATMAKVSGEVGDLGAGKWVHGKSIRAGFVMDTVVANSLMSVYCKCGDFGEGRKVFDEMPERNVGSWNVLMAGYRSTTDHDFDKGLLETAKCMMMSGVKPDGFTVSSLLPLCGGDDSGKLDYGRELHCLYCEVWIGFEFGFGCSSWVLFD
ncbi:hypothetical protein M0R45_018586 [Rubus argutus]|uniref:Pentatricopeptide repeat-containing protein n=1 Tax=Rubus argutus TaxID=59490 RepID=A0AAW1X6D9_RUBAR